VNLIVLGPQGSGKGTQAELLTKKYNLEHVNMGGMLRQVAKQVTPLGKKIDKIINVERTLIPNDILKEVLRLEIESLNREQSLIFDGVPRTLKQVSDFEEVLLQTGRKINKLIYINVSEDESIKRISKRWMCEKCRQVLIMGKDVKSPDDQCPTCESRIMQRADDTLEGVNKRLEIFHNETVPVIEYFREKGLMVEINGEQAMEEVFKDICEKIDDHN